MIKALLFISILLPASSFASFICKTETINISDIDRGEFASKKLGGLSIGIYYRTLNDIKVLNKSMELIPNAKNKSNESPPWLNKQAITLTNKSWAKSSLRSINDNYFIF